jgi:hypothetical protein|tara:strand:+ start:1845 stop:2231 length:387 start_codon:yes stop_codon:yes gene_type:complete
MTTMADLKSLKEYDEKILYSLKEYGHPKNFPEMKQLYESLKQIEDDIKNDYPSVVISSELDTKINAQKVLLEEFDGILVQYNENAENRKSLFGDKLSNNVNNYLKNYVDIKKSIGSLEKVNTKTEDVV